MKQEELRKAVFENIGLASMAWSETPKGVFDTELATKAGEAIMKAIEEYAAQKQSPMRWEEIRPIIGRIIMRNNNATAIAKIEELVKDHFNLPQSIQEGGTVEEVLQNHIGVFPYKLPSLEPFKTAMTEYASQVSATDKNRIWELERQLEEIETLYKSEPVNFLLSNALRGGDKVTTPLLEALYERTANQYKARIEELEKNMEAQDLNVEILLGQKEELSKEVERLRGLVEKASNRGYYETAEDYADRVQSILK